MNRLTYSLRRSILMTLLSRVTRRVDLQFAQSQSMADTRLGIVLSTQSVLADWDLAASVRKQRVSLSLAVLMGYWRVGVNVII